MKNKMKVVIYRHRGRIGFMALCVRCGAGGALWGTPYNAHEAARRHTLRCPYWDMNASVRQYNSGSNDG